MKKLEKGIKRDVIFEKYYDYLKSEIELSNLPTDLLPTDIISIEPCKAYYSENNSWDDHTYVRVYREREETDEEFNKRNIKFEKDREYFKKRRYENYLQLKKEFENEEK